MHEIYCYFFKRRSFSVCLVMNLSGGIVLSAALDRPMKDLDSLTNENYHRVLFVNTLETKMCNILIMKP